MAEPPPLLLRKPDFKTSSLFSRKLSGGFKRHACFFPLLFSFG